jgi:hypothetical protein
MLKSIEEFASYVHKHTGNLYTRYVCKVCFRAGNVAYKKSVQPRVCLECNEKKAHTEFPNYKSLGVNDRRRKVCKVCTTKYEKEKYRNKRLLNNEEKGEPVHWRPNTYISTEQKDLAFELMEALGFTFQPDTGIWFKEGLKNEDGTFVGIEEKKRLEKERKLKEIEDLDVWSKVTYLREAGTTINQISIDTGVNVTAVQKFLQYGKKVQLRN